MTSYSRGSPYGRKHETVLHLIYRIDDGVFVPFGLFETREKAEEEIVFLNRGGFRHHSELWKIADIGCTGWGIIDGVVARNEPDKGEWDLIELFKPVDESLWTDWQRDA